MLGAETDVNIPRSAILDLSALSRIERPRILPPVGFEPALADREAGSVVDLVLEVESDKGIRKGDKLGSARPTPLNFNSQRSPCPG